MALISKTIANLINGVSQQPPSIRNPTQCEVQENYLSDTTHENCHRPHSEFVKKFMSLGAAAAVPYFHTINRGVGSQYKVMITNGDLKVFDLLTGVEKTVSFPDGKTYLVASDPKADFQCLTVGSKTYVLNRTKVVTEAYLASLYDYDYRDNFLVFVKQGDYSTDYTVTVSLTNIPTGIVTGPTAVTKTTSPTVANDIKTTQIATDLKTGLDSAFTAKLVTTRVNSTLWCSGIVALPVSNFAITGVALEDSKGNNNTRLIRTQMQKFADLPTVAPAYWSVQIVGDKASGYDDYHVRFFPDDPNSTFGNGSWQETWKHGTHFQPTPVSMPLVLVDNGDGTFTCQESTWEAREAGDTLTNPSPPFIGKKLQSMFTFGNRLGFLFDGEVALSEVGVFTNFYLTTVITFLDSDPIFIKSLSGFDKWLYAVPLAEKIVLFAEKGQAIISGDGLLTPKTASLKGATQYPVAPTCPPELIGDNIYFTANNGPNSKVYEYYVQGDVESFKAADITSHVPRYLPSGLIRLVGDDASRIVVALGSSAALTAVNSDWSHLYIYKYFWYGDQKVQSSWSRWSFPDLVNVVDASLLDGVLYLCSIKSSIGDVVYHKINLDVSQVDTAPSVTKTHLDFRMDSASLSPSEALGVVTVTLPFIVDAASQSAWRVYKKEQQAASPRVSWGVQVPIIAWLSTTQFTFAGTAATPYWVGTTYASVYTPSEIHLKEDQNGQQVPTSGGKLTLKKISFLYNESFYLRVEVTPDASRATKVYPVTPYVIGDPTPVGTVKARTGQKTVPVNAENTRVSISVVNDSVVPHRLQSAEWTGQYTIHSRRV